MERIRTRVILAFIFLALVQIACGCSLNKAANVFVYEDTNGDGTQNRGEPAFPGVFLNWDNEKGTRSGTTDSDRQASYSYNAGNETCFTGNFPRYVHSVNTDSYRVSEYTGDTPWNCSPPAAFSYIGWVYDEEAQ